jgi:hypothetical protein
MFAGLEESDSGEDTETEEGVAFQRHWFLQTPEEILALGSRESRLRSVKATLRRRYVTYQCSSQVSSLL